MKFRVFILSLLFWSGTAMAEENLNNGDTGTYEELLLKENPENLVLLYIPGIEAVLARAEDLNGGELTLEQNQEIRMKSSAVATTEDVANAVQENRGYE